MALIECADCKRDISDLAVACPHCGRPLSIHQPTISPDIGTTAERTTVRALSPAQGAGLSACALGMTIVLYFFMVFDSSVEVPSTIILGQEVGGGRVENIGLLNQRQNGIIVGGLILVVGVVLLVVGKVHPQGPLLPAQIPPTSPEPQAPHPERYRCGICSQEFHSRTTIFTHLRVSHRLTGVEIHDRLAEAAVHDAEGPNV